MDETISQQPDPQASGDQGQASTQEPQPKESLTADDVRRIAREEALRTSQSLTDKAEARINKHLSTLKDSGVQVTPGQEQGLRATITKEVMEEERGGQADLTSQQRQPATQVNSVVSEALELMTEYGVQIEDGDAELPDMLKVINDPLATRAKRIKAVADAIETKRNRVNQSAANAHLRTPPGGGEPAPTSAKNSRELWNKAYGSKP